MADDIGRPEYTEEQYHKWFDDLAPFFKLGETLNEAIDDAGLVHVRTTLYRKSKLGDWFWNKMSTYQSYPGKLANNILVRRLYDIEEAMRQKRPITKDDMDDVKFVAEKHRSSVVHFVNRTETAAAKSADEILDEFDKTDDNVDDVASTIKEQMVSDKQPIQN